MKKRATKHGHRETGTKEKTKGQTWCKQERVHNVERTLWQVNTCEYRHQRIQHQGGHGASLHFAVCRHERFTDESPNLKVAL